jgi:hypothetical protein
MSVDVTVLRVFTDKKAISAIHSVSSTPLSSTLIDTSALQPN